MSEDGQVTPATLQVESGRVYTTVTRYWPRIAVGLVAAVGVAGWAMEGLTADSGIEFYLMAWGATTGGLWFLFEKAEKALAPEIKKQLTGWLEDRDMADRAGSIPSQFGALFDAVFGERHLSGHCFVRSSLASVLSVAVVGSILAPHYWTTLQPGGHIHELRALEVVAALCVAISVNLIPDYLSLLETRWMVRLASARRGAVLIAGLVLDFGATLAIGLACWGGVLWALGDSTGVPLLPVPAMVLMFWVGLGSTFFTSVWLWLYAASVLVSRVLVRMGGGVGFLLRVTDVEKQPFRSMGFVSVIIVSVLFALGLPLVVF